MFTHHQNAGKHNAITRRKQPDAAPCEAQLDAGPRRAQLDAAPRRVSRRACLTAGAATLLAANATISTATSAEADVRLGILQFGTVQWVADVISRNKLDSSHGIALRTQTLANTDAGRVALMAKSADIITSDWTFVASQRAAGTKLCFAPFSSATGGIMVQPASPVRSLADLAHRRLGVAGGPLDKSWLIVRAAAKAAAGIDLADAADVVYAAPPLLNAKLMQNELDAVLTYWNFAARLEVGGSRQLISVSDCTRDLGFTSTPCLLGFVFHQDWAEQNPAAISGFLAAAAAAEELLARSEPEWRQVRPVMNATDDAVFTSFRRRFVDGITHPSAAAQETDARKLFNILLRTGGKRGTDGLEELPAGIFWPTSNA